MRKCGRAICKKHQFIRYSSFLIQKNQVTAQLSPKLFIPVGELELPFNFTNTGSNINNLESL